MGYLGGINIYWYCANNPINWLDPFGWDKGKSWLEKSWDWWSELVAPGEGGVMPAKRDESWGEYFERFRGERIHEFAISEALGIAGSWTSIGSTTVQVAFSEGLRITGSKLGNRFVSIGGEGFWYMRGVPAAMKWRQVASGAAKGGAITWIVTAAATGYRIGLQLDAWLSYNLTKRE